MTNEEANTAQVQANTLRQKAETIRVLMDLGFERKSALAAVTANDLTTLAS